MMLLWITLVAVLLLSDGLDANDDIISHLTRETCMDELGCFSANSPFFDIIERPISLLPDERESINTKFLLYKPSNPEVSQNFSNLDNSIEVLLKTKFNPYVNTTFVVPGFISKTAPEWKMPIKNALLVSTGGNVFMVDWSGGDGFPYEQAVANTRVVGAEIALFIQKLQNTTGINPESVHIIGHSLGSHIAGYAGKRTKNLGRITAMDPAGPYFTNVNPVVRLNRNDALLVDAIHTNAAATRFQGFGMTESIGHFDFYPNGGYLQPGCLDMGHAIWAYLQHPTFDSSAFNGIECNHVRAIKLYISSLTGKCDLLGTPCDSWENFLNGTCGVCSGNNATKCIPLGAHANSFTDRKIKDQSMNFYMETTSNEPYCK